MRILQLIQKQQLRGAEIFASQLSEQLFRYGHEVMLVSLFKGNAELAFSGKRFCIEASQERRFFDVRSWKKLNEIICEFKPDIVQANAGDTLKYAVFSKLLFRWKARIIFRNASLMSAFINGYLHRHFNQFLLNRCDYFISVSENCRQDLITLYPGAKDRSTTIPIGTFSFDSVVPIKREVSSSEPVFINIASFVPEKNQSFLLDIFHEYVMRHNKGHLWLVGDGKLSESLREKVSKLNLEDRVCFWGYRKEVISILKASDVFIMPSYIEGMPGAILESLSCHVPVIVSDVGGIPEIIHHYVNGFCLNNHNAQEYIRCMETLTTNNELREKFTEAGNKTIQSGYLLPVITLRFHKCYLDVASKRMDTNLKK